MLLLMRLSQFHNPIQEFGGLTHVDSGPFLFFLINFLISSFNIGLIGN
jgi:hypothetical protein